MFAVTVWGGVWSVVISLLAYTIVRDMGIIDYRNFLGAFLIIGPIEEMAKFLALLSSYYFIKDELNEPTDGLVYMACVALGFSLIENYFYAVKTPNSGYLIFFRLLMATPLHIFASLFMGLAFYVLVKLKGGLPLVVVAFLYGVLIHGLYDGVIFHSWLFVFLLLILIVAYRWALLLLSYTTAKSPFRPNLGYALNNQNDTKITQGMQCPHCGNTEDKETYTVGRATIQQCNGCHYYVASVKSLYEIFHHFGSDFRNLRRHYQATDGIDPEFSTLFQGNYISEDKKIAFFRVEELERALEQFNTRLIEEVENQWWFYNGLSIR